MSHDLSFHVLSLPRLCSTEDAVLQVHTNVPVPPTPVPVLTAGGVQLPQHSFQHSLQLKAHPYREAHNMCTSLKGGTQHVLIPQHTPIILCAEDRGRQHKDIWHTGHTLFPLFKKMSCRHSCGWGSKADLCCVSLLSDSNKRFWSHYHGELDHLIRSEHHQCNPQASWPGCSIFVFFSHSLMQVFSVTCWVEQWYKENQTCIPVTSNCWLHWAFYVVPLDMCHDIWIQCFLSSILSIFDLCVCFTPSNCHTDTNVHSYVCMMSIKNKDTWQIWYSLSSLFWLWGKQSCFEVPEESTSKDF